MSKEDKFKNHLSLTVVKEDDRCEGKALGCMEIMELGVKLFCETVEELVTYKAESSRKLCVERTEVLTFPMLEKTVYEKNRNYIVSAQSQP